MSDRYAAHRRLVHAFFDAVQAGDLPDDLLTDDMQAWLTTQGTISKAAYQNAIRLLARMSREPLIYTFDAITCEDDRVAVELRSEGVLIDDQPYANSYFFAFRIRGDRIALVREHFNALIVQERLYPLMAKLQN